MTDKPVPRQQLIAEIDELRARLAETEETLRAIRGGEVDALVLTGAEGDSILTLKGGLEPYRVMVESMGDGAVTLAMDGTILYCNQRFA
ncbi:MAG TPA: PAS domain-containing protein, partial [Pseudomonadales bacterium]|nr:PAS domain-containing protein [Pseudomonadales bacterium]